MSSGRFDAANTSNHPMKPRPTWSAKSPDAHAEDVLLDLRGWYDHWFGSEAVHGFQRDVYEPLYVAEVDPDLFVAEAGKYDVEFGPGSPFSARGVIKALRKFELPCRPTRAETPYYGELIAA